ncbi:MAG: TIGR03986 family CRISPR-associated RAMP protein [Selenomonadaceae bacterium]|nr:TIGR03986 family CRISPR-associated RAMP protein [Selenomonadaceae bacterium]
MAKKNKSKPSAEKQSSSMKGFDALGKLFGIKPPHEPKPEPKTFSPRKSMPFAPIDYDKATAPYNFISLPTKVLPSPIGDVDFKTYIEGHERLSGEITLELEALTPLFIGGNVLDDKLSFAPAGSPILPGSSLRGMFKNIFKLVTCGALRGETSTLKRGEDFNDEHIYFRCLMATSRDPLWMHDLNALYNSRMTNTVKGKGGRSIPVKNARPGFLIKLEDGRYMIAPSIYAHDRKEDRILIKEYEKKFNDRLEVRGSRVTWQGREAYIITGSQPRFRLHDKKSYEQLSDEEKKKAGKQFIRFTSIDHIDWCRDHWFELGDDLRISYERDRNRRGVDLFKDKGILKRDQLKKLVKDLPADIKTLVPCHFLVEGGELTAFGHGQCFRIPYKNRIGDAVPEALKTDRIDFADAVFGREANWASRVYFDDAKPTLDPNTLPTELAHPLMQPNPTSYQLYLKQEGGKLKHWDTKGARIRGYKRYWHNAQPNWQADDAELKVDQERLERKQDPLCREITPLEKGSKFKSKIRFDNLSAVELGALLMVFDLNGKGATAAYKLGKGKPFGFGSLKVRTKLFIERDDAYDDLIGVDGWTDPLRAEDGKKYIDAFKSYVDECDMTADWRNVMDDLTAMLNWDQTKRAGWKDKIASMSGNVADKDSVDPRFKNRAVLPDVHAVLKG